MSDSGKIRITLVSIHPAKSPQSVPLASAFLAATLKNTPDLASRVTVTVIDLYNGQTAAECADVVIATAPDMVGFSVYIWNREQCVSIAKLLKEQFNELVIFCGGPEATADQYRLLSEGSWDFLIQGEGEATLAATVKRLANRLGTAGIPGTAALENGVLKSYPAPELIDLGKIPSPLLSGEIDPAKYPGMLWQISRGCSFSCDFCFDGGGSSKVRRFPLERIEAELKWFAANRVSQVFVLDSTFNSDRERAVRILRLIKKIAPHSHFHFEVRSEFLDRQQAELFASITCSLQIGLQSADPDVLKKSGRSFSRSDFTSKVAFLNDSGAVFGFDLIYGLPGDTLAGFRNSVDFALGLYPNHLDIFPLALLPGTRLAARSRELQLQHNPEPPYILTSSPTFPNEDMAAAARLAAACDLFYSRGKAVSWFLSMLHPLKMKPNLFLESFYGYAEKRGINPEVAEGLSDCRIFELQQGFISELFLEKKLHKLLPIALDIIRYNFGYAAALMATPPKPPTEKQLAKIDPAKLPLKLAGSARLATFSYEILEVLDSGIADLRELAAAFSPSGSTAVIYPKDGQVLTESLFEAYYRLLGKLDGRRPAGEIAKELGIPSEDTGSFLEFALLEGIVVGEYLK